MGYVGLLAHKIKIQFLSSLVQMVVLATSSTFLFYIGCETSILCIVYRFIHRI
jgi:hypothetical protein